MIAAQRALLSWYQRSGRAHLPWRAVRNSYYTIVSEVMLQQTQVDRVTPKFAEFVAVFPDFAALAKASTADVLRAWKGLGYNSRAARLKQLAVAVVQRFGGTMPDDEEALRGLPGVGPYTVNAVRAFAFDEDVAACDVNVRRVVHRVMLGAEFPAQESGRELDARATAFVPRAKGHDWNSAMMDLGATICTARAPKCLICPLQQWCAAAPIDAARLETLRRQYARRPSPQEALKFERTTRYARGRIVDRLRELPPGMKISLLDLHRDLAPKLHGRRQPETDAIVTALVRDGLVVSDESGVRLAE